MNLSMATPHTLTQQIKYDSSMVLGETEELGEGRRGYAEGGSGELGSEVLVVYWFAIQVLLIHPGWCTAFLENYKGCFILKSCGGYLVMFTICFLSSGTGLQYLGLSSDGTAPNPAVAVAPYRSQAFSEIAGLLASALLTVNALSIIILLRPAKYNTIFEVAATLTLESAMALLYMYPYVTVAAAVFIMAVTILKNFLCCNHQK
nr:hypothetical protein CFP56_56846 [Quercus suber]